MPREFKITDARHGAAFAVRVVTGASAVGVCGVHDDGALEICLTEGLGAGRADAQLIDFLAAALEVDPAQIAIVVGAGRPHKIISVENVSPAWIEQRLIRGG